MRHIDGLHDGDVLVSEGYTAISGVVSGDVLVEDGRLTVTGIVEGNVTILGGTAQLLGKVAGDVVNEGGQVVVAGSVGGIIGGRSTDTTIEVEDKVFVDAPTGPPGPRGSVPPARRLPRSGAGRRLPRPQTETTLSSARDLSKPTMSASTLAISSARRRRTQLNVALAVGCIVGLAALAVLVFLVL